MAEGPSDGGSALALDVELMGSSQQQPPPRAVVIPKVRERLRGVSGELFTPQTMPIGFYYHSKDSSSLTWAEGKKRKAVSDLLRKVVVDPERFMEGMRHKVRGMMREVMGCYTHRSDDGREGWGWEALLIDGWYLISLLLEIGQEGLRPIETGGDFGNSDDDVPKILTQDNTLVRDILYLLENQLPLFALRKMLNFFMKFTTQEKLGQRWWFFLERIAWPVEHLLQKQLYISKTTRPPPPQEDPPSDLLHLVHYYFRRPQQGVQGHSPPGPPIAIISPRREDSSPPHRLIGPWRPRWGSRLGVAHQGLTSSWRRATYYRKYADLRFKRREFGDDDEWTILDVDLQGGTLCIPFLRVDTTTWTLLRNLMALEEQEEERPVTAYCYFMSQLACTAEDVERLQRARILEHFLGSDEQAARGFAQLCDGVDLDVDKLERTYLSTMLKELDKRCSMPVHNLKGLFREKYCGNMFQRLVFSMAALLFVLQVTQVIYAALSYHKPPK